MGSFACGSESSTFGDPNDPNNGTNGNGVPGGSSGLGEIYQFVVRSDHHSPTQLQLEKADIVLELRRSKRLTAAKIAAALRLARSTVARLLQRNGLGRLALLEPKPEPRSYEWPHPGGATRGPTSPWRR